MKLWLDFEPCKKCAKYIADLTDEEFSLPMILQEMRCHLNFCDI